jgi:hypothetical protein
MFFLLSILFQTKQNQKSVENKFIYFGLKIYQDYIFLVFAIQTFLCSVEIKLNKSDVFLANK